jgi:uncharacterized membrane protein YfhO
VQPSSIWNPKKYLPFVFLLSIFTLYFFPILFEGKTFFFRDISHFAYPMKWYMAQILALGEWPFWYPNLLQGTPLMPLMHPGVFYPPSALFLIKDFLFAFHAYFLFHHLILMGSVYALCRYWGNSIQASLCASVTSLLGGYFLALAAVYNHFQTAIWFPLILMMWQRYMAKGSLTYFCSAVVLIAFQVLGGGPENAIFTVLLIYTHSLYLPKEGDRIHGFIQKTLAIFALVLMALALSALQWVPTYYFLQEIARGNGLDYATSTLWSVNPGALLDLFLPEKFMPLLEREGGTLEYFIHSFYMGIVPLFVFFSCLLIARGHKAIRFWLAVFGVGVFFALGKFNPFYSLFHEWVPLFDMFRYPQKFFFLCAFAFVFLVGLSLDRITAGLSNDKSEIKKLLLALLITAMGVAVIFGMHPDRGGTETLMILLLIIFGIFALHLKKISQTGFLYFLLLLMVMDLMGKNSMVAPMIEKKYYTEPPALAKRLGGTADSFRIYNWMPKASKKTLPDPTSNEPAIASPQLRKFFYNLLSIHLEVRENIYPNLGAIYDLAYVNGEATMMVNASFRWRDEFALSEFSKKKIILERSNVKYWVTEAYDQMPSDQNLMGTRKVLVFEDALPRAFLVGDSQNVQEDRLLDVYYDSEFDPLKQVLLTESVSVKKTENFSGQVEELNYPPNGVNIKTSQSGEGFLVLLDTWFPGWQVTVDGAPQLIYRANSFYRAIKLGPGNHSIEFSYMPVGLKMGVYISSSALILIVLLFFKRTRIRQ